MECAEPAKWVKQPYVGYFINAGFSEENTKILDKLANDIAANFDEGIFCMPSESFHITLLDWIAPLISYDGQDKDKLFAQIESEYDQAMTEILFSTGPIAVHFDTINISPSTIYITATDGGQFAKVRKQFLEKVQLLPNTKLPPQIIHSSVARFTKPIDLLPVRSFLAAQSIDFTQTVSEFRLIHGKREPMLEFEILKRYKLT